MSVVEELAYKWQQAGISQGDTILIHSSLKRTLKSLMKEDQKISPQVILDSFLEAVGSSGTLLLPLFNFDFTEGIPFDYNNTPSKMGILTELARKHPNAIRTGHPIYSFAVIGHHSEKFRTVNNFSGYGHDSPFATLRQMNGKIAVLDLPDQNSMTFYHHVEEMNLVSYRYQKTFTGEYIDGTGHKDVRTYGLFVRNIEAGVITHVNPLGELMWENGLYSGFRPGENCGLRVVNAQKMFDFVSKIIASGKSKGLLYRIEGEADD
jgi:aminoglycoside 3-N-acetyltransferase